MHDVHVDLVLGRAVDAAVETEADNEHSAIDNEPAILISVHSLIKGGLILAILVRN